MAIMNHKFIPATGSSTFPYLFASLPQKPKPSLMACSTNSYNLLINLFQRASVSFNPSSSSFYSRARSTNNHEPHTILTRSSSNPTNLFNIKLQTLEACRLGIGRYPDFQYNSSGGIGIGTATGKSKDMNPAEEIFAVFDIEKLYIPPLTDANTRFLGMPLPPLMKIEIAPEIFQGWINRKSGKVELQFRAKFWFSIGRIYRPPPLMVETILTSDESNGSMRGGKGEMMYKGGMCKLVGVATIDPINDFLMNSFLGLPTECFAELNAQILITA